MGAQEKSTASSNSMQVSSYYSFFAVWPPGNCGKESENSESCDILGLKLLL